MRKEWPVQRGRLEAIVFDFDNTLVETLPLVFAAFNAVLQRYHGVTYDNERILSLFGPSEEVIIPTRLVKDGRAGEAFELFLQFYKGHHRQMASMYDGVPELLSTCRRLGLALGLFTAKSRRTLEISLEACGLAPYFDAIVSGDDVSAHKPDPEGLNLAMRQMGCQPATTVTIGDSAKDIIAGQQAGAYTIAALWGALHPQELLASNPDDAARFVDELRLWVMDNRV